MDVSDKDQRIIEAVLAGGVKIPSMPGVLVELAELDRNGEAGPREYAAVIGRDPGLAGAVFRVVGSPVFGLRAKAESLEKAVTLLGLTTTRAVAYGEALRTVLTDAAMENVMTTLWQRAQLIAELMVATLKAAGLRGVTRDQAFLLGLFHDCGVAVACRRYPAYARALSEAPAWPDLIALDRLHQTDHAVVGQMVARNWQLPADITLAIRHHHDHRFEELPEPVTRLIVLLQFAMHLTNRKTGGEDAEWAQWQPHAQGLLGEDAVGLSVLEEEALLEATRI